MANNRGVQPETERGITGKRPMANNRNYQLEMEREIARIRASGRKPRLVLHVCCAPCSSAVLERLAADFEIVALYDNPNIAPAEEFAHRASELKRLIAEMLPDGHVRAEIAPYDPETFYAATRGHADDPETGARCAICYALRLRRAAEAAKKTGADYFTTTLSVSPLKDAAKLNAIGGALAAEFGVRYLFSDFKKKDGYRRSCALSREYGLYRQDFCGCVFSREQRHPELEDMDAIKARLHKPHEIELHETLDSTNLRAHALAQNGAKHGTVVIADTQTAGRGRFDRKFHSPSGTGVYMSVILRESLNAPTLITPMAAVAVARAIDRVSGLRSEIKWVNDVYLNGKKVCGILCASGMREGKMDFAVVGIGVNVGATEFPEELKEIATSITNEIDGANGENNAPRQSAVSRSSGDGENNAPRQSAVSRECVNGEISVPRQSVISRSRMIAEILNELDALAENPSACMEEYRARSNVIGKPVIVFRGEETFDAEAVGIDGDGGLIVRASDGLRTLRSGEISVRVRKR